MKPDPQIYPSERSPKGWSKWFAVQRKHIHVCCHCGAAHDLEQKLEESSTGLVVMERWRDNERETIKERKRWSAKKHKAWLRFLCLD